MGHGAFDRDLDLLREPFDLVVIGAGITGVQVAREAAGRGLRVALFDQGDLGSGTSSATTKYLHGGIRYLEQYQFGVVRESLRERRILSLGAPHLVEQRPFLMPAWRWSKPPAPLIGAGVGLYTAMAWDRNRSAPPSMRIPLPRWLGRDRTRREVPWLDGDGLRGAFLYHDTLNVHPERLLLAYARDAASMGAVVRTHTKVDGFVVADRTGREGAHPSDGATVVGVDVTDAATGERRTVRARAVVNAGGPWMDIVLRPLESDDRRRVTRPLGVRVQRSKGVHLLTRPLGGSATVFCRAPNGAHVVVSPWQGGSFIGPTDTPVDDEPESVFADGDDVEQILDTVNATIGPGRPPLTVDDVEHVTVGIRPLAESGSNTYTASRRHEVYDHAPAGAAHLWSIAGGKWTTGRATAVAVLDEITAHPALRGRSTRRFDSAARAAHGTFAWAGDADEFFSLVERSPGANRLPRAATRQLARTHGTEAIELLARVDAEPSLATLVSARPGRLDLAVAVIAAVETEGARTLADIVDRRLVLGTLGPVDATELRSVAELAAPTLGWTADEIESQVAAELARRAAVAARWRP